MPLTMNDFIKTLTSQLTEAERRGGVAYAVERQLPAGTNLQLPGTRIELTTASYLGFIDREPGANWGHSARYVIVDQQTGKAHSLETRLPPFRGGLYLPWRVVYQAPSVHDSAVESTK